MFRRLFHGKKACEQHNEVIQESPGTDTTRQVRKRNSTKWTNLTNSISSTKASIQTIERVVPNMSSVITIYLSVALSKSPVANEYNKTAPTDYGALLLAKTLREHRQYKAHSTSRKPKPVNQFPAHIFNKLPREVYDCIVSQIEQIHFSQDQACPSCYLKDLYNLALVSRAWDRAATSKMYSKVLVLANEDHPRLPKLKIRGEGRLKLLRRTLLERTILARCVRVLDLSDFQSLYQNATIDREGIVNLVASLVMACPQLESLVGFHVPYTHSFDRLSHALSTRSKLQERLWLLTAPDDESQEEDTCDMSDCYNVASDPTECFLDLNSNHPALTTLMLHQDYSHVPSPQNFRAIIGTIRQFPLLQNLSISGLTATSFTNMTLSALPSNLRSLRLENLPGINAKGIQRFVTSPSAVSIESLKLIDLEITSLVTIANIFSTHLANLKRFSLAQHQAPDLPPQASIPGFYSGSLQRIHWEIRSQAGLLPALHPTSFHPFSDSWSLAQPSSPFTNPEPTSCLATSLLATSIQDGAFPSLREIRIPHDPQGLIQALCKPLATALLPSDVSRLTSPPRMSGSAASSTPLDAHIQLSTEPEHPRADSAMDSPILTANSLQPALTPIRSRVAAQHRIVAARNKPVKFVRIHDPEGNVQVNEVVGGFVGHFDSKIVYNLNPDRGCTAQDVVGDDKVEDNYWIAGVEDVSGRRETAGVRKRAWRVCNHPVGGTAGMNVVRLGEMC